MLIIDFIQPYKTIYDYMLSKDGYMLTMYDYVQIYMCLNMTVDDYMLIIYCFIFHINYIYDYMEEKY